MTNNAKSFTSRGFIDDGKRKIEVTARYSDGYFSFTGETWIKANNNRWVWESCGCIHDEIAAYFPDSIAPLLPLHLSDALTGEPMHAQANGAFWLGGFLQSINLTHWSKPDQTPDECRELAIKHYRITRAEFDQYLEGLDYTATRTELADLSTRILADMALRYSSQAAKAKGLIDLWCASAE